MGLETRPQLLSVLAPHVRPLNKSAPLSLRSTRRPSNRHQPEPRSRLQPKAPTASALVPAPQPASLPESSSDKVKGPQSDPISPECQPAGRPRASASARHPAAAGACRDMQRAGPLQLPAPPPRSEMLAPHRLRGSTHTSPRGGRLATPRPVTQLGRPGPLHCVTVSVTLTASDTFHLLACRSPPSPHRAQDLGGATNMVSCARCCRFPRSQAPARYAAAAGRSFT